MIPTSYLFILGNTPELAFLELQSFFPQTERIHEEVARVRDIGFTSVHALLSQLGGTVKIAVEHHDIPELSVDHIAPFFTGKKTNIHFGISIYGDKLPSSILSQVKESLERAGIKARYAASRHGNTISSVTIDKSGITELIIIKTPFGFTTGITEGVQEYASWSERDYDRPFSDSKSGMLPPKVSRMIVNIAVGSKKAAEATILLDPFCGMGTILAEGYMRGCQVLGADVDEEVVRKARGNLTWLAGRYPETGGTILGLMVADAVHMSSTISQHVHAIVTEPYMGSTDIVNVKHIDTNKIKNTIKGLEKLYIGCLRDWGRLLAQGSIVVIALPEYSIGGRAYFVKKVIDMCESLGYTTQAGPIEYGRPQAIVRRKFFVFRKK